MLVKRIFTGIVLLVFLLLAVFYLPEKIWIIFTALLAGITLWEFCAMAKMQKTATWSYLLISAIVAVAAIYFGYRMGVVEQFVVLLFWFLFVPIYLCKRWILKENILTRLLGWILIFPTWFALIQWRAGPDGAKLLVSIVGIACVADTAAYCAGKAIGKHKLAINISPGKTWEGAICGIAAAVLYVQIMNSIGWLPVALSAYWLVVLALVLASLSICGDLLESLFKRGAGIKDSSNLLPGHGGVYDRVDGILAVLAVSSALFSVIIYLR